MPGPLEGPLRGCEDSEARGVSSPLSGLEMQCTLEERTRRLATLADGGFLCPFTPEARGRGSRVSS